MPQLFLEALDQAPKILLCRSGRCDPEQRPIIQALDRGADAVGKSFALPELKLDPVREEAVPYLRAREELLIDRPKGPNPGDSGLTRPNLLGYQPG